MSERHLSPTMLRNLSRLDAGETTDGHGMRPLVRRGLADEREAYFGPWTITREGRALLIRYRAAI